MNTLVQAAVDAANATNDKADELIVRMADLKTALDGFIATAGDRLSDEDKAALQGIADAAGAQIGEDQAALDADTVPAA